MILGERFGRALVFTSELHCSQKRKTSGVPYVAHLLGVCALVLEDGGSEDEAIAALLHDSVEDQGVAYPGGVPALRKYIGEQFGEEVDRLVFALTERPGPSVALIRDKKERWRAHKQDYISRILSYDLPVRRVSCADNLHNVRSLITGYRVMGDRMWSRFLTRDASDQLWAYSSIARAFLQAGGTGLALELDDAVERLCQITGKPRPC